MKIPENDLIKIAEPDLMKIAEHNLIKIPQHDGNNILFFQEEFYFALKPYRVTVD